MLGLEPGREVPVEVPRDTAPDQIPMIALGLASEALNAGAGGMRRNELPVRQGEVPGTGRSALLRQPEGPDRGEGEGESGLDLTGALSQLASWTQMLPGLGIGAKLGTLLLPGAVHAAGDLASGQEISWDEIIGETALGAAPMGVRKLAEAPAAAVRGLNTYEKAVTRGGAKVKKGYPTIDGPLSKSGGPLPVEQLKRLGALAQRERLTLEPESLERVVKMSVAIDQELMRQLPKQAIVNSSQDLLAAASKYLGKSAAPLIRQREDLDLLFSLMQQSRSANQIAGGVSRWQAGLSGGGLASMASAATGVGSPLVAGMVTGIPLAMLNASPNVAMKFANASNRLADTGGPWLEASTRAATTTARASGYPKRERLEDRRARRAREQP